MKFQEHSPIQSMPDQPQIGLTNKTMLKSMMKKSKAITPDKPAGKRGRPKKKWEAPRLGDGPKMRTLKDMSPEEQEKMKELYED